MPKSVYEGRVKDPELQLHLTTFPPRREGRPRITEEQLDEAAQWLIPALDDVEWRWRDELTNSVPKPR